eukprot:1843572-Rhodomonas_salina.4
MPKKEGDPFEADETATPESENKAENKPDTGQTKKPGCDKGHAKCCQSCKHKTDAQREHEIRTFRFWHQKFGHLNYQQLVEMSSITPGMPNLTGYSYPPCQTCMACKSKRKKRKKKAERQATQPLEQVYCDYAGPFKQPSSGGAYYYLILVNCKTRKPWVRLARTPYMFLPLFEKFCIEVGTPEILLSNNGPEMVSAKAEEFFAKLGVQCEKSAPHSQNQNGTAEHGVCTLTEAVLCFLKVSNAPRHLWGHAVRFAAYIRGFCPMHSLDPGETPNSLFYADGSRGPGPNPLDHSPFGCYAVIYCCKQLVGDWKLSYRGIEGIYLGVEDYETGSAHLVSANGRIWCSPDVVTDPEYFPYLNLKVNDTDPFAPAVEGGLSPADRLFDSLKQAAPESGGIADSTGYASNPGLPGHYYVLIEDTDLEYEVPMHVPVLDKRRQNRARHSFCQQQAGQKRTDHMQS